MEELSLHILDIIENSVSANASLIKVTIDWSETNDLLTIIIDDNGIGIDEDLLEKIESPFYTSKKERKLKIGLGIPLYKFIALQTGGTFSIKSSKGKGTQVNATFGLSHIDRPPLGNILNTIISVVIGHLNTDFEFKIQRNGKEFVFFTNELKNELGDVPLNYPDVIKFIEKTIIEGLQNIDLKANKIY